ncbi:MAG: hypothetical protein IRZ00_05550 [Gemmatimonadetes bacterium]|nr:hypothetical protein [Gemmatimonadota bacterium]
MPTPLPDSSLERVFYRLGHLLEELSPHGDGKASAVRPADELRRVAVAAALTRVLRPRKVRWVRLVAASLLGTALGEALSRLATDSISDADLDALLRAEIEAEEAALRGHAEAAAAGAGPRGAAGADAETGEASIEADGSVREVGEGPVEADGAELAAGEAAAEAGRALARRAAADLVAAAAYAALVYPRIPGPAVLKGLAFGLLDAGTGTAGGVVGVLEGLAPRLRIPLARLHPGGVQREAIRALALGLALGLVYPGPARKDGAK